MNTTGERGGVSPPVQIVDGTTWSVQQFSGKRICPGCAREFPEPSPELLSFTSPLGACPECGGTGVNTVSSASVSGAKRRYKANTPQLESSCPTCHGNRLNRDALALQLRGLTLPAVTGMEIGDLSVWHRDTVDTCHRFAVSAATGF